MPRIIQVQRRALDEARKIQKEKAEVATSIIPRFRSLLPVQKFLNRDELHEWTKKSQKELSIIEELLGEKIDFSTSYKESAKTVIKDVKLAFEREQMSKDTLGELNLIHDEARNVKNREIREILSCLIEVSGKDVILSHLNALADTSSSKAQTLPLPNDIDPRIIEGCVQYLEMDGNSEPTITTIVNSMKITRQKVTDLERKIALQSTVPSPPNTVISKEMERRIEAQRQTSIIQGSPAVRKRFLVGPTTPVKKLPQRSSIYDLPISSPVENSPSPEEKISLPNTGLGKRKKSSSNRKLGNAKTSSTSRKSDNENASSSNHHPENNKIYSSGHNLRSTKALAANQSIDTLSFSQPLEPTKEQLMNDLDNIQEENRNLQTEINDITSRLENLEILCEDLEDSSNQFKCRLHFANTAAFSCLRLKTRTPLGLLLAACLMSSVNFAAVMFCLFVGLQ
ncbi:hypothetical protein BTUL_0010g01170 [Botrytis tulipae]|uniref:Uncharacterized protein n=1 Tax=Botrytis tulipae TaxID=87230 RepID=A0A4Z1F259_9HELO|nr:hypothetical protein BTUL_0010g01170 [Botrytis tulipae]